MDKVKKTLLFMPFLIRELTVLCLSKVLKIKSTLLPNSSTVKDLGTKSNVVKAGGTMLPWL